MKEVLQRQKIVLVVFAVVFLQLVFLVGKNAPPISANELILYYDATVSQYSKDSPVNGKISYCVGNISSGKDACDKAYAGGQNKYEAKVVETSQQIEMCGVMSNVDKISCIIPTATPTPTPTPTPIPYIPAQTAPPVQRKLIRMGAYFYSAANKTMGGPCCGDAYHSNPQNAAECKRPKIGGFDYKSESYINNEAACIGAYNAGWVYKPRNPEPSAAYQDICGARLDSIVPIEILCEDHNAASSTNNTSTTTNTTTNTTTSNTIDDGSTPAVPAAPSVSSDISKLCPEGYKSLCFNLENKPGIVGNIVTVLIITAIVLSIVFLILGGIHWIMSGGDKAKVEAAKSAVTAAVIGLIISLLGYFIVTMVVWFLTGMADLKTLNIPRLID